MSIFNNKLPGDFYRKKDDCVAAATVRLWLCSWPRLWHLISGAGGGQGLEKKLGNITITTTYPSGTLGADCCSPHRLNNPTLNPSPDPAALIGLGLSGSWPLIGGAAEQQAAGWSISPPHQDHIDVGPHGTISEISVWDNREKWTTSPWPLCPSPQKSRGKTTVGAGRLEKEIFFLHVKSLFSDWITLNHFGWSLSDQI